VISDPSWSVSDDEDVGLPLDDGDDDDVVVAMLLGIAVSPTHLQRSAPAMENG
jgi:hypothetical protein